MQNLILVYHPIARNQDAKMPYSEHLPLKLGMEVRGG